MVTLLARHAALMIALVVAIAALVVPKVAAAGEAPPTPCLAGR